MTADKFNPTFLASIAALAIDSAPILENLANASILEAISDKTCPAATPSACANLPIALTASFAASLDAPVKSINPFWNEIKSFVATPKRVANCPICLMFFALTFSNVPKVFINSPAIAPASCPVPFNKRFAFIMEPCKATDCLNANPCSFA